MNPGRVAALALGLALLGRAGEALADPPRGIIPANPWTTVDPFPLSGSGVTAPTRLPDGRVAVFTRAPSTLALIDAESGSVRSSPVEEPPADCTSRSCIVPRVDALGRLVILGAGGTLFRLGLDGRVRVAAQLPGELLGVIERADGTQVAAVSRQQHVDFVTLRRDGSIAATRTLPASATTTPAVLPGGGVAVGVPRGIAVFDPAGTIRLVPAVEGVRHLVSVGGAALAITETSIYPLDPDGIAGPPRPLPAPTRWWSSSTDGVALAWIDGPPPALLQVDRSGALRRVEAPPFAEAAVLDGAGAVLLASRLGRLVALESDGRERWVVDLRRAIVPRVTLGAHGDAWVTTIDGSVLRLSCPPPSAQEAPRAHR